MSSSGGTAGISRNKDGVPQWSGEPALFQEFEEQSLLYEQSQPYRKRYLVAPRLQAELPGPARRLVVVSRPDWVSYNGGVRELLDTLRSLLGRPQVSELKDHLNRYFRHKCRKAHEAMGDYISQKCEAYLRAQQALRRGAGGPAWAPRFYTSPRRTSHRPQLDAGG